MLFFAAVLCAAVVCSLAIAVSLAGHPLGLDSGVGRFVTSHRAPDTTTAMRTITWLGSILILLPAILLGAVYLFRRGHGWTPAAKLLLALGWGVALQNILKLVVERHRPPAALSLTQYSGTAFPSGHATQAMAAYGMLALLLGAGRSRTTRGAVWTLAGALILAVGVSRLYLGAHWLTDVVGGYALGAFCVLIVVALFGWTSATGADSSRA